MIIRVNIAQLPVQIEYHVQPNLKEVELHLLHAHADKDILIMHPHLVMHVMYFEKPVLQLGALTVLHVQIVLIYSVPQPESQVVQQITHQALTIENVSLTLLNC